MSLTAKQEAFFVYALIDPRDESWFYVGKGKGSRPADHLKDFRAGRVTNGLKHKRIGDIVSAGLEPTIHIISSCLTESQALGVEWREIAKRKQFLTNIKHGSKCPNDKADAICDSMISEIGERSEWLGRMKPEMAVVYKKYGGPEAFYDWIVDTINSMRPRNHLI